MRQTVLLVDDDPILIQVMGRILGGLADIRFAMDGAGALKHMRVMPPDLVLLDAEMPGMSGYAVCEEILRDPELSHIPVMFVTGHGGVDLELKGLKTGAVDFVTKPISEALLKARVQTQLRVKRLTDELRAVATVDALTEVLNRRSFDNALEREWRRVQRMQTDISLLMIDVDDFKRYNDTYGHPAGDACLRQVALALREAALRPGDLVARYGGEEFAVLLPQTPARGAQYLAGRMLAAVADLRIPHGGSRTAAHVTVSIGVATFDAARASAQAPPAGTGRVACAADLLKSADQALYRAKSAGRAQAWATELTEAGKPAIAHPAERPELCVQNP